MHPKAVPLRSQFHPEGSYMLHSIRRRSATISLIALFTFAGAAAAQIIPGTGTTPATVEELKSDILVYTQHINTVANPYMEGRAPGTTGNRRAADYIEFCFKKYGFTPAFPLETKDADGNVLSSVPSANFRQEFVAPASLRPGDSIKLISSSAEYAIESGPQVNLVAGTDYNVIGYSGKAEATGKLAFVGYSLRKGENDYATYADADSLEGKIAVIFRFEPMDENGKSLWATDRWSPAASIEPKLRAAADRGAAGIILVNPPGAQDDRVNKLEDMGLTGNRSLKIPVVMMSIEAAGRLLSAADTQNRSLLDFRTTADKAGGVIDLPNATVTLKAEIERVPTLSDNVGGILAGKGNLAEEIIVIGAHYDHVGYGYFGSRDPKGRGRLHPGADDNGSGTSGLLLVAEKLSKAYAQLPEGSNARTIFFMAFSAEESGLNGSRYYTKNMIRPLDKHYLMLNMDMIGRLREDELEIHGVGTAVGLADFTQPFIDDSGMKVAVKRSGFGPSDHSSFTTARVPVLFFHTGLHDEYHMPTDFAWTINCEGAARVCDLVSRIAMAAAARPEPLPFGDGKPAEPTTEEPKDAQASTPLQGVGVRFGIAPGDYSGEEKGVLIGEVMEGLPAEKAGLKSGDLMTSWNGTALESVEAWMPLLGKHKAGDKVVITYTRDGKEMTTEATLVARARRQE